MPDVDITAIHASTDRVSLKLDTATAAALTANERAAAAETANRDLATRITTLEGVNATQAATITAQATEILRLQAIIDGEPPPDPDPDPEPPGDPIKQKMLIGACPSTTGSPADVMSKYGNGVSIREFYTGWGAAQKPAGCRCFYPSWKPTLGSAITDQQIINAVVNLDDGDIVSLHHETPTKVRNGSMTVAQANQALAQQNDLYARVVRLREAGTIPHIFASWCEAAWLWDNTSGLYPGSATDAKTAAYWLPKIEADLLGPDFDAYANMTKYPDFLTRVVPNVLASVKQYGFDGWCVPEMIHPRIQNSSGQVVDTDGTQRAAWLTKQIDGMRALPVADQPVGIFLFDTEWAGRPQQAIIKPSKEHAAIMAAIAKIPA